MEWRAVLVAPVVETLTLHPEPNDNLAAFFWLQRTFQWGSGHLTKYSPDHLAYDHLFLALYRQEVAEEFACIEWNREWQQEYSPQAETIASYVRNSFRRIGRGAAASGNLDFFDFTRRQKIESCNCATPVTSDRERGGFAGTAGNA
jgi:hypothetical protein